MCRQNSVEGCDIVGSTTRNCNICKLAEGTKLPFGHTRPRATSFLQDVHGDLSGIIRHKGLFNESYYILFTNNFSSYCHIYPLSDKTKEETFEVFKLYIAMSEQQTGCKLKQFTLDCGGEFVNSLLGATLSDLGVVLHLTAGHTPMKNGVAERSN